LRAETVEALVVDEAGCAVATAARVRTGPLTAARNARRARFEIDASPVRRSDAVASASSGSIAAAAPVAELARKRRRSRGATPRS
jgi:hypothetical protein